MAKLLFAETEFRPDELRLIGLSPGGKDIEIHIDMDLDVAETIADAMWRFIKTADKRVAVARAAMRGREGEE